MLKAMTPDQYQSLSNVYGLLARFWLSEVDTPLLRSLCEIESNLKLSLSDQDINDPLFIERLAVDFCALWIGPKDHLPPYQSVWQDGQLQTETADSVKSFGAVIHFDEFGDVMPDHLGIQLQIMGRALGLLSAKPDSEDLLDLCREFFHRHLTWPQRLLNAATQKAQTEFYESVIQMTADFLESEKSEWSL